MATEMRVEAMRTLYIAVGIFALVAFMSFAWAAVEAQQTGAAPPHDTKTVAALPN